MLFRESAHVSHVKKVFDKRRSHVLAVPVYSFVRHVCQSMFVHEVTKKVIVHFY